MGKLAGAVPDSWTTAMASGNTFHFGKCLNSIICQWIGITEPRRQSLLAETLPESVASHYQEEPQLTHHHQEEPQVIHRHSHHREKRFHDPCSAYLDCKTCIEALDYCGWCSDPVLYNGTIPGANCAGLNKTVNPGLICPGAYFSTVDCKNQPTPPPTDDESHAPTAQPAPHYVGPLFVCKPDTQQCVPVNPNNASGGMPMEFCKLVCTIIPYTPPILVNRVWRGYQINKGYERGEWRAVFTERDATITDHRGVAIKAKVGTTAQFLILDLQSGQRLYTWWQLARASPIDYFSWAWGAPNQLPPRSFDEAMTKPGEREFQFMACPCYTDTSCFKQPNIPCKFDH